MRNISDLCAFREVVPGVGPFPSKVLSSCSLRSSVNMILLLMRSLNRSSHRSNLRNLPSQQQEYFQFFNSVWDCARVGALELERRERRKRKCTEGRKGNEDRSGIKFPSRSHDRTIARSLVCPSANVLCPPVFISLSASWPSVVPGVCLYIFTSNGLSS